MATTPIARGLALAALVLGCNRSAVPQTTEASGRLHGAGGVALLPYIQGAATEFQARHPAIGTKVEEARSSVAIKDLIDSRVDFAFTSRPLRGGDLEDATKKGKQLHMVVVGAEAVAVIVHPSNPLRDITPDQLRAIFFAGTIKDWGQLTGGTKTGPIHVFAVNPKTSGTGELFASMVAKDDKVAYAAGSVLVDYSDATIAKVAGDPDAVSFSGMGNVNDKVRAMTLGGVAATEKTILDTSYLLNRKLFVITNGPPKGTNRDFIKFLLSDEGQHIARARGLTPIVLE